MKVAMITPYYNESAEILKRCHDSVINQTYRDITHIMIADSVPNEECKSWKLEHMELPFRHNDAGATPRAIAAISAFARGYDAVGFIDADNWIEPNHVEHMITTLRVHNAVGVVATRTMYTTDCKEMYVDTIESNGENMVDTNCMFLTKIALHLMTYWVTEPKHRLVSDRAFWNAVQATKIPIARCTIPTVAYVTRWAWHYEYAGLVPPPDSVWLVSDAEGNVKHLKHSDKKENNES